MADYPPPRMRLSRSTLQESQQNYASEFLGDSVQLGGISAPFPDQQSDDYSLWKQRTNDHQQGLEEAEEDMEEDDEQQYSSNSATPGPSRTTMHPSLAGGDTPAGRLRILVKRAGPATPPVPKPARPRSEAESDFLESDDPQVVAPYGGIKDAFMRSGVDSDTAATPRQAQSGSKIPISGGRKQRRLSLESSPQHQSGGKSILDEGTSRRRVVDNLRSAPSASLDILKGHLENMNTNDDVPSSGTEITLDHSPPPTPKVDNLNESVVDFPSYTEESVVEPPRGGTKAKSQSPIPSARPRTTSAGSASKTRFPFFQRRERPASAIDREYGEISFVSGEVESSTPIKTKTERQQDLERSWGRASPSSRRNSYIGDRSVSPAVSNISDDHYSRSHSPIEVWEKDREKNWNSPRPKPIGARPDSGEVRRRRDSQDSVGNGSVSGRSRVDSAGSMSSSTSFAKGDRHTYSPSPAPSPAPSNPSSPSRARTSSTQTPAEVARDREKSWNRPTTPNQPHVRTTSMPGLDASILALRASPAPQLNRSHSLGNGHSKSPSSLPRPRGNGAVVYRPTTPSSSLIRRSSLISAVQEETEPESRGAHSDASSQDASQPAPYGSSYFPTHASPQPSEQDEVSFDQRSENSFAKMERDASRLQRAMAGSTLSQPPLESTTPISTPPRPADPAPVSTTPQDSPVRALDIRPTEIVTPSKRGFHPYPAGFETPSPPKGGLPPLSPSSSEGDGDEEEFQAVKEPVRGVVVPLSRFGGNRSYVAKTPKPPGGWATPATSVPPFDDREHPHPKGEALAALQLKDEEGLQSESEATPVIRLQDLEDDVKSPPEQFVSAPETPARDSGAIPLVQESMSVSRLDPETPAPPGQWLNTPHQRKSILKVRFDSPTKSSQAKQISRPTTPDHVVANTMTLLEQMANATSDDEFGKSGARGAPRKDESPRKRSKVNMVDSFGRELVYASDGTPIKRLSERTESFDSQMSVETFMTNVAVPITSVHTAHPGVTESSAVEMSVTTPRRRQKMRMVDSYGNEVHDDGQATDGQANKDAVPAAVFDLNSPMDAAENEGLDDWDDLKYDNRTKIKKLRRAIDSLYGTNSSMDASFSSMDTDSDEAQLIRLQQMSEHSRTTRTQRQRELMLLPSKLEYIEVPSGSCRSKLQKAARIIRRTPWLLYIFFALSSVLFSWAFFYYAENRAEKLFLTTYHDPVYAGFHDIGDPYPPSVSEWILLGHDYNPVYTVKSMVAEALYHSFGFSTFGERGFRPNPVPT